MPEFRKEPLLDTWVIFAEERGKRPQDFSGSEEINRDVDTCPFDPGNEDLTPPEIYADRSDPEQRDDWNVRVVPNKHPALAIEGDLNRTAEGMFDRMNGVGAHEVVIESPDHDSSPADYSVDQMERVFKAYQERTIDLRQDGRLKYIMVFKNHGAEAGASLEHPHSQIISLPIIPKRVKHQLSSAREHYLDKKRCIYCDIIDQEVEKDKRIIAKNDDFIVWSHYAARVPFETWILPRQHSHDFATIDDSTRRSFARITRNTLAKLSQALQDPPYNFLINTAPNFNGDNAIQSPVDHTIESDYHWHLEIIPKITHQAGFEWGSDFHLNPTLPEEATRFLREKI